MTTLVCRPVDTPRAMPARDRPGAVLRRVFDLMEPVLAAETPEAASRAFHRGVRPHGATYLQTRAYRRPAARLTSDSHWQAGGFIVRLAPRGWANSAAFNYICFECNPLLDAIRSGLTRYRFSDFAPPDDPRFAAYWDALSEADIAEALCATAYGSGRRVASLHLGFNRRDFAPGEAEAIQMAGTVLVERIMQLAEPPQDDDGVDGRLTPRERDALGFAADGKSDWEIGVILGVAESTARFHLDNARRKLGAVNRTQAVAKMAVAGLL